MDPLTERRLIEASRDITLALQSINGNLSDLRDDLRRRERGSSDPYEAIEGAIERGLAEVAEALRPPAAPPAPALPPAVVGLAAALATLPWGDADAPIAGTELVDAVSRHAAAFLATVAATGVTLPDTWQPLYRDAPDEAAGPPAAPRADRRFTVSVYLAASGPGVDRNLFDDTVLAVDEEEAIAIVSRRYPDAGYGYEARPDDDDDDEDEDDAPEAE